MPLTFLIKDILPHYQNLGHPVKISPILLGQINKTFLIETDKQKFILQQLSPIFTKEVMNDAWAVANHLIIKGLLAPKLLPCDQGNLWLELNEKLFRAITFINGKCYKNINSLAMAKEAGISLAKFHLALNDFNYEYCSKRAHGGNYNFHIENLCNALKNFSDHGYYDRVAKLAEHMIMELNHLITDHKTTPRHAHGDPKISNLIFDDFGKVKAFIDFDTLGNTGWSLELADAIRSWCNPNTEDNLSSYIDLDLVHQVINGYSSLIKGVFTLKESYEVSINLQAITLCLAIRYAEDTLKESLFLHDKNKYKRPAEHTWLKAQSTYNLYRDILSKHNKLEMILKQL